MVPKIPVSAFELTQEQQFELRALQLRIQNAPPEVLRDSVLLLKQETCMLRNVLRSIGHGNGTD